MTARTRALRYSLWMLFRFSLAGVVLVALVVLVFMGLGSNYSFEWDKALEFLSWYNRGLGVTLELFVFSATLAVSLGLLVALMRLSPWGPVRDLAGLYVHTFRNLPALVVLLLFFFGLGQIIPLPTIRAPALPHVEILLGAALVAVYAYVLRFKWKRLSAGKKAALLISLAGVSYLLFLLSPITLFGKDYNNIFLWGVIAFGVYESSYLGETFRAGIQSVHRTQIEAAQSLGMNYLQVMGYVVLPQALRVILPPLTSTLVALVKETALIYLVRGIGDLTDQARQLAVPTRRPYIFEFYTILVCYYLAIVIPLSVLSQWLEGKLGISKARRMAVHHDA